MLEQAPISAQPTTSPNAVLPTIDSERRKFLQYAVLTALGLAGCNKPAPPYAGQHAIRNTSQSQSIPEVQKMDISHSLALKEKQVELTVEGRTFTLDHWILNGMKISPDGFLKQTPEQKEGTSLKDMITDVSYSPNQDVSIHFQGGVFTIQEENVEPLLKALQDYEYCESTMASVENVPYSISLNAPSWLAYKLARCNFREDIEVPDLEGTCTLHWKEEAPQHIVEAKAEERRHQRVLTVRRLLSKVIPDVP